MKKLQTAHKEFFSHIANVIAKNKRQIIGVIPSKKELGFAYTIGNQEKGLPELLLIGNFDSESIAAILNQLSDRMLELKQPFVNESLHNLGGTLSVKLLDALPEAHVKYTIQAGQFYANEDYDVQQVVIPDQKGRWPDDPQCHKNFRVPLLRKEQSHEADQDRAGGNPGKAG